VLRLAPAAIRALGESTALADLAGVSFVEGRSRFLPFNILTLVPAMLLGTPVVKLPQAMGPFGERLNRCAARLVLPRCRMVWARGERTAEHVRRASFPVRFATADDIAFNHRDAYALTRENEEGVASFLAAVRTARAGARGVVGLCPSSVVAVQAAKEGGNYEPVLAGLVRGLAQEGFQVVLFPNATRAADPVGQRNNDLPLMRRLVAAVGGASPAPMALDMDIGASGIKQVIAAMDVVLVSRFHAMVGALSLGVPVAVLGWSHKYAEVMARFGLEDNVMDYRQLDGERLRASVRGVFEAREAIRHAIAASLPAIKASAERPVLALLSPSLGADLA
jgi:polysaccharide pyruvyl transferase WcaK-like protein